MLLGNIVGWMLWHGEKSEKKKRIRQLQEMYESRWCLIHFISNEIENKLVEICEKRRMPRWTAKDIEEIMPNGVPLVPFADVEEILDNLEELQKVVNEYMDAVRHYRTEYERVQENLLPLDGGGIRRPFRDIHQ